MNQALNLKRLLLFIVLGVLLIWVCLGSLSLGAADISPQAVLRIVFSGVAGEHGDVEHFVIWNIRLPRTVVAVIVGAALAASGAALQGMFRNPMADPALIGITAGGSLGAVAAMVFANVVSGGVMVGEFVRGGIGLWAVPLCAFVGAFVVTSLVYQLSKLSGRVTVAHMLLVGIAMNALCGALTGLLIVTANDQQLREITFWTLGGLGFVTSQQVPAVLVLVVLPLLGYVLCARGLNALMIGEGEAFSMGVNLERLKWVVVLCSALSVGAAVAFCGGIGFIGLVAPHLVRLMIGGDHRFLLPGAALMGGLLLCGADMLARTLAAPAELPVGIVTAALGAPFFLFLLLRGTRV